MARAKAKAEPKAKPKAKAKSKAKAKPRPKAKAPAPAAKERRSTLRVTLTKSVAGRLKRHKACVVGLGLRRIGQTVEVEDSPAVRGMIDRVHYLVRVEEEV